jgi:SAM-dependent methyltransferase
MGLLDLRGRSEELPLPPPLLRDLVGGLGPDAYENRKGTPIFDSLPRQAYESVFDLGCGCGRVGRLLMLQRRRWRPSHYLGVDLHHGMIDWCQRNLAPHVPGFEFEHHDIFNPGLNPAGASRLLRLPAGDDEYSLFIAISVFTHMAEDQAEHYLREAARILRPDGYLQSTWFLFDKSDFPMMQDFQNALFINESDPFNAVIFDRGWLRDTARDAGLRITRVLVPEVKGFQWEVEMRPHASDAQEVELPVDTAPVGRRPPPLMPPGAADL